MIKPIYFPSCGITTTGYISKFLDDQIGEGNYLKSPRFYNPDEDSYFNHPYILLSAALHYKTPDIRGPMRISEKTKVFIDSGGYQLAVGSIDLNKYSNKIALDWSEANGDIFPILDHPLTDNCDKQERLDASIAAAKFYTDNRSKSGKQILNVISARTLEGAKWWHDGVKDYKLDGWAHGGHKGVLTPVLQTFMMLGNAGEFNRDYTVPYHIFGISSQIALVYFAVLQREAIRRGWNVQIMSDSSSFQISLGHGSISLMPNISSIAHYRLSNKFDLSKIEPDMKLPCDCPVCKGVVNIKDFIECSKDFYLLGALHNLFLVLRYKNIIDSLVYLDTTHDAEIMKSAFPAKMYANILAIRDAMSDPKVGVKKIWHTFNHREISDPATLLDHFDEE